MTEYAVAFLTGIMASMGLGGGMLLIVYLTIFEGMGQLAAQGINLVFFLPIAAASLVFHIKNHLTEIKKAVPAIITGTVSSALFSLLATFLKGSILSRAFGIFLIICGVKILFSRDKQKR